MEALFFHVSNVLVPVLLCILVGYALARFRKRFDTKTVGDVVANVGYPTLILSHLTENHISFGEFLDVMAAAAVMIAGFTLIGYAFLKIIRRPVRAFLSPMMLNNVGNIGLPISLLAFGSDGMAIALAVVAVVIAGIFTVGMWLPIGKVSLTDLIRQPAVYSVVIALLLMGTGTSLPGPIAACSKILGGLAVPLMLLTLGYTLATLRVEGMITGLYLAAFHIAMAGAVAYMIVWLFGFTGTTRGVFILMCLMPASVATYLWVERYQNEHASDVASFIMASTLLTILVVPLALTYWI
ncbi:transporter [Sneathiella chungangensis]|uniref:Transporter n=1 Tax=Sneathiella chungangensis TaxID=1418234 RepID=A0A845MKT5_9PROT|nr:transporter [Sneathiella chungangensis]